MKLPCSIPIDDPEGVWALQLNLLSIAETLFGPRDPSKTLCQPRFDGPMPNVRFTIDKCGVFAELSKNGKRYWPTVLYELAHETIHLLNPGLLGTVNYLEEGVAVAFSIYAQHLYSIPDSDFQEPKKNNGNEYSIAWALVNALPKPLFVHASLLRQMTGSLSNVSSKHLLCLFPDIDVSFADALTCKFPPPTDV